jgi:hypothetical protein
VPGPRLLARTKVFASGLQESPQALAHLLMGKKLAAFQSGLAPFHGFDKTVFFLEVTRNDILHDLIQFDSLLRRSLREAGLQIGIKLDFHGLKIR